MKLMIVDYGLGNLLSVQHAFRHLGVEARVTDDGSELLGADGLIIPGVGAFPPAMQRLREKGLDRVLKMAVQQRHTPTLGICLGMQVLYQLGVEGQPTPGLGLLRGEVQPLPVGLKVPHMGWNQLRVVAESPLLQGINSGDHVYFVHSFYAADTHANELLAVTDYGLEIPAVVGRGRLLGVQFHPEKSGETGLRLLANFLEVIRCSSSQPST